MPCLRSRVTIFHLVVRDEVTSQGAGQEYRTELRAGIFPHSCSGPQLAQIEYTTRAAGLDYTSAIQRYLLGNTVFGLGRCLPLTQESKSGAYRRHTESLPTRTEWQTKSRGRQAAYDFVPAFFSF